jgi:hypothetical protein
MAMAELTFEPLVPASLWLLLAVATAVLLTGYGWSRPGRISGRAWGLMLVLMAGGIGLVLAVLLNPTWVDPVDPPAGRPLLTILVDESASMAVKDAADGRSRYESAREIARNLATEAAARFDVRVRTFAGQLAPTDTAGLAARQPKGAVTDIGTALAGSVEENRPAGQIVVLLSDGIHNAGAGVRDVLASVRSARAAGAPVFTRPVGRSDAPEVYDLEAQIRSPQQLAYVGQKTPLVVRIRQRGGAGGDTEVTLLHEGRPIDRQTVNLPPTGPAEARFMISGETPGAYRYEVRVEPRPGELIGANNTAVEFLNVVNEPIRVLLLEGKPYWDNKFLMRTLSADPVVGLDSVVRMAEGRYLRRALGTPGGTTAPAPEGRDERWKILASVSDILSDPASLKQYQIIVLGRDTEAFLTESGVSSLRQWISRQGGSLVCYRGSPAAQVGQRLASVLPVQWAEGSEARFHMNLTEQGQSLRWLGDLDDRVDGAALARLPSLATVSRIDRPRPLTTVLATARPAGGGDEWPVISCQNYGTGRVVVIEGSGMWRWAFLPPANQELSAVYGTLWQSLMRWLVSGTALRPGRKMDLRCENVVFDSSEPACAALVVAEEAAAGGVPSVELRVADEQTAIGRFTPAASGDDPGVYRVSFGRLPPGQYEARVADSGPAGPSARFDVRAPVREQLELAARPDLLGKIAEDSGGAVLQSGSGHEVIGLFDAFQHRTRPERVRRVSAWDRWYVLLGVMGVWMVCWGIRRSGGLI